MKIGSLFSGIGGLELGLERAGLGRVAWQVEQDEWCRGVLATHWPGAERYEDVRNVGARNLDPVDLVCGGFPCQDVSGAGKGAGLSGARSGLWYEYRRILEEIAPPIAIVENVTSGARRWLPHVRRDLHLLGFRTRAFSLSAFDCGAPHLRKRVFVLATHPERVQLRKQPGGGWGSEWSGPAFVANDGAQGATSDAHGMRKLQSAWGERYQWRWARHGDGWAPEPPVPGVDDGFPDRARWEKAFGNAVNVACAEVIGRIVLEIVST